MSTARSSKSAFISSPRELIVEMFRTGMAAAVRHMGSAIMPIYYAKENGRAGHLGTCILFRRHNRHFLITAAHVIDAHLQSQLLIPIRGELKLILGNAIMTTPPAKGRRFDKFDFAVVALDQAFVHDLGDKRHISDDALHAGDWDTSGRMYVAVGYPNSRNDKNIDHRKRQIRPAPFSYGATVVSDEAFAKKLGVSGRDHLFLKYDKRSRDVDGVVVNSIDPHGMSGGALIDMGKASAAALAANTTPSVFRLVGLLIEYHRTDRTMVAVRIDTVVGAIDDAIRDGRLN
jgi:hypothetical protein